ncbi:MAG: PRD domain-containing protein [Erysipelotrichaceae bacterium]|nr:PRD domain-containing protein [Erysipelotrichaceae bacterium]
MEIKKIFNNNVVVVEKDGRDQVICGRGIAFSKKIGDKVDEDKITQVFVMKEEKENERFQEIIQNIPLEYIELSNEIIEMIKLSIGQKINDIIYISLSDHIYTAVERAKEGIYMPNTMTFEISHYYENEYRLALKALKMINERFDVDLKEDEAGFMTLHIVNAEEENSSLEETTKVTQIVQEIIKVVRNFYGRDFYEDSVYFLSIYNSY